MPRTTQKLTQKSRKKTTNPNKGLPKKYIEEYGNPVYWTMISRAAWNEFYQSDAGKARLDRLIERQDADFNRMNALYNDQNPAPARRTNAQALAQIKRDREAAKVNARK